MTEPKRNIKKISRRDAIKLLGAVTGATVLANLPSKWSTPQLTSGVLPAHAQTSNLGLTIQNCDFTWGPNGWSSTPYVVPLPLPMAISMKFTITLVNTFLDLVDPNQTSYVGSSSIDPTTGATNYVGENLLGRLMADAIDSISGQVTILWEFNDSSQGTGSCSRTLSWFSTD